MNSVDVREIAIQNESPSHPPMLEVSDLHHEYRARSGTNVAIDNLSFTVDKHELVAIVGPSGAGKTTLLRCLSGLLQPTSGTVEMLGQRVSGVPDGMAMVFQDYGRSLYPWMKVNANVSFPLLRLGLSRDERRARVDNALAAVGLAKSKTMYPWELSGGMQQRVAIARALAYQPRLLIMDEPFASVDAQTRAELEDLVLSIWEVRSDMTILFVTHDIDESIYLSDRTLVLSRPPSTLARDVTIDLARPRNQIDTKADPKFVRLRTEVTKLITQP